MGKRERRLDELGGLMRGIRAGFGISEGHATTWLS